MTLQEFQEALANEDPPQVSRALAALWYDAKGDWQSAHEMAQEDPSADGAWVHAYLHRKEGDISNAGYWYRREGKPAESGPLEAEREKIAQVLLGD